VNTGENAQQPRTDAEDDNDPRALTTLLESVKNSSAADLMMLTQLV